MSGGLISFRALSGDKLKVRCTRFNICRFGLALICVIGIWEDSTGGTKLMLSSKQRRADVTQDSGGGGAFHFIISSFHHFVSLIALMYGPPTSSTSYMLELCTYYELGSLQGKTQCPNLIEYHRCATASNAHHAGAPNWPRSSSVFSTTLAPLLAPANLISHPFSLAYIPLLFK